MAAIPAWFWLVLFAIPVGIAVALVYYNREAATTTVRRRWGISRRDQTIAVFLWFATVVVLGVLGDVPGPSDETSIESFGLVVMAWSVPLGAGLLGIGGAVEFGRRWRRLRSGRTDPTGEGGPLVRSGPVRVDEGTASPVTGREAVCWSWYVDVRDPYGAEAAGQRGGWVTVEAGGGGIPFSVGGAHTSVDVDPSDVRLDLPAERTRSFDADEPPEASFGDPAPDVERSHGDKGRRYHEAILAPTDHATVVAQAPRAVESPVGGRDVLLTSGTPKTVRDRYRTRALALATGGVAGVAVGVAGLVNTFGVAVP